MDGESRAHTLGDVERNPGPTIKGRNPGGGRKPFAKKPETGRPATKKRSRKKKEKTESGSDPLAIRLRHEPDGCPHCGRGPFFEGFSSSLCCDNGNDVGPILDPLPPAMEEEFARPGFGAHSISVNDALAVSSLAYSGGRIFVHSGQETTTRPDQQKKTAPQSLKMKGTTSTRIMPTPAASARFVHCGSKISKVLSSRPF